MKKLNDTVFAAGNSSKVWIGLYNHIDLKWSDGFNESGAENGNWAILRDQSYSEGNQFCLIMINHALWYHYYCHKQGPFLCYRGTLEDSDFVLVNTAKNWTESQRHCREHFTDLATVRNRTDSDEIHNLTKHLPWAWIGLYGYLQFYWSDGSNYSFSSWYKHPQSLDSLKVKCGVADLKNGGNWRLFSCEERKPFVCYSVPTVKTLVKVRVNLQDSSVDLNDPAVKEQILKEASLQNPP
ncbi:proteoglycan 3-like [Hippoglossus stenolepis]|uniref:proteoglycan 3-like n=1 Tax=Hippoglossus stenolepis TaxID=195615 RepID=UPI001FB0303C|nr:proteoglycan 3-like [Hippoglossus stenolepis]